MTKSQKEYQQAAVSLRMRNNTLHAMIFHLKKHVDASNLSRLIKEEIAHNERIAREQQYLAKHAGLCL